MSSQVNHILDSNTLHSWVNCKIEFHLTSGEHLIGTLLKVVNNVYYFTNLNLISGEFWSYRQKYSYSDFCGQLICLDKCIGIDLDKVTSRAEQAEKDLFYKINDKKEIIVPVDPDDDFNSNVDTEPDEVEIPSRKDIGYENFEFDFFLDNEDFDGYSNEVLVIFADDPKLEDAIETLESSNDVGLTVLPSVNDRDAPIDFIIFGCEKGTFVFPNIKGIMNILKPILESEEVCKVMHDSCHAAARFYRAYNVDITNIDDTQVLDCELEMRHAKISKRSRNREARTYENCVYDFLSINLPWNEVDDFYKKCGEGKLLASPLDVTGASYVRGLVMPLMVLRFEMLKHLFFPVLVKQYNFVNCLKYASDMEYSQLKAYNFLSPRHLADAELHNPNVVNLSTIPAISGLMAQKFAHFSKKWAPKTRSFAIQCDRYVESRKIESPKPIKLPYFSRNYFDPETRQLVPINGTLIRPENAIYYDNQTILHSSDEANSNVSNNSNNYDNSNNSNGSNNFNDSSSSSGYNDEDEPDWTAIAAATNHRRGVVKVVPAGFIG